MTTEEEELEAAMAEYEFLRSKSNYKELPWAPPTTPAPEPTTTTTGEDYSNLPGEDATVLDQAAHIGGGVVKGLQDMAMLPKTIAQWITGKMGVDPEQKNKYQINTNDPISDMLARNAGEGLDWLKKPRVDPKHNPTSDALRTGAEYFNPGAVRNIPNLVVNAAGMAAPAAVDHSDMLEGQPEWLQTLAETGSSIFGSILAGRVVTPSRTTNQAVDAINVNQTGELKPESAPNALWESLTTWDPQKYINEARKNLYAGQRGTLADVTNNPDLHNIEASLPRGSAGERALGEEIAARLRQQVGEAETGFRATGADPKLARTEALNTATTERTGLTNAMDAERAALAQSQADDILVAGQARTDAELASSVEKQAALDARNTQAQQINTEYTAAQQGLTNARAAEEQARLAANTLEQSGMPHVNQVGASTQGAEALRGTDKTLFNTQKEAWKKVDDDITPIPKEKVKKLKDSIDALIEELPEAAVSDFKRVYRHEMKQMDDWDAEQLKNLGYIKHKMGEIAANAHMSDTSSVLTSTAGKVSKEIDAFLNKHPLYKDAVQKTAHMYNTIRKPFLRKKMNNEAYETLFNRMGTSGEQGAYVARMLKGSESPEALAAYGRYLKAKAYNQKGGVNENFLRDHAPALDAFPALKTELEGVVTGKLTAATKAKELKDTEAATKQTTGMLNKRENASVAAVDKAKGVHDTGLKKAETAYGKALREANARQEAGGSDVAKRQTAAEAKIAAKLSTQYGEKPETVMKSLLESRDQTENLTNLYAGLKTPAEKASFRAHARNEILGAATGEKSFKRLTKPVRDRLVESGVVSRNEMDSIESVLKQTEKDASLRKNAKGNVLPLKLDDAEKLASSLQVAMVSRAVGMRSQLMVISESTKFLKRQRLKKKYSPAIQKRIAEYLANPKEFVKAFDKVQDTDVFAALLMNKIHGAAVVTKDSTNEEEE